MDAGPAVGVLVQRTDTAHWCAPSPLRTCSNWASWSDNSRPTQYTASDAAVAIGSFKTDACVDIQTRQNKCPNNIVEQYYRTIRRISRLMLRSKCLRNARIFVECIETMHMIKMGQMPRPAVSTVSAAELFYSLAA